MKSIFFLPILYILILITSKTLNCYSTINWLEIILLLPLCIVLTFSYYKITEFIIKTLLKKEDISKEKREEMVKRGVFLPANILMTGFFVSITCLLIINLYLGCLLLIITLLLTFVSIFKNNKSLFSENLSTQKRSTKILLGSFLFILIILNPLLYVSYIPLRYEFIDIILVENRSMSPTINYRNVLLINKIKGITSKPKNNALVLSKNPLHNKEKEGLFSLMLKGLKKNDSYIRRVVGTPGDSISFNATTGFKKNNKELNETYIKEFDKNELCKLAKHCNEEKIDKNSYYLLADNRNASQDSRIWSDVNIKCLKGEIFAIIWPKQKARILD